MRLKCSYLSIFVATCTVPHYGLSIWNTSILGCQLLTTMILENYFKLIIYGVFLNCYWFWCRLFQCAHEKHVLASEKEFITVQKNWYVSVLPLMSLFMVTSWMLDGNHYCSDGASWCDPFTYIIKYTHYSVWTNVLLWLDSLKITFVYRMSVETTLRGNDKYPFLWKYNVCIPQSNCFTVHMQTVLYHPTYKNSGLYNNVAI